MDEDFIIKDFMTKRSSGRSKIVKIDNFKARWFLLYPSRLVYHEGNLEKGVGKEKGSIPLCNIKCVEEASIHEVDSEKPNGFQVWYTEKDNNAYLRLYISAVKPSMRDEWITALRNQCKLQGNTMATKYHPSLWTRDRGMFICCGQRDLQALGCSNTYNATVPPMHTTVHKSNSSGEDQTPTVRVVPVDSSKEFEELGSNSNPPNLSPSPSHGSRWSPRMSPRSNAGPPTTPRTGRMQGAQSATNLSPRRSPRQERGGSPGPLPRNQHSSNQRLAPSSFPPNHANLIDLASPTEVQPPTVTPPSPRPNGHLNQRRVRAAYDYTSTSSEDLSFKKGDILTILDDKQEPYWWKARNSRGQTGFIPHNFVEPEDMVKSITEYSWFYPELERQQAIHILKNDGRDGVFLVRPSVRARGSDQYTVGIFSTEGGKHDGLVKHYHIKQDETTQHYYLSVNHKQPTIEKVIEYHARDGAGLISRLRFYPNEEVAPPTIGLERGKFLILESDLQMMELLGKGNFGEVWRAKFKGTRDVAVKKSLPTLKDQDFIDEAKVMMNLQHRYLVQLYGLVERPQLMIVTEFMKEGALSSYLKKHRGRLPSSVFIHMSIQVSEAMEYMDMQGHIHRDLAARNCLVGANYVIKVADFGLSRHVIDDEYTSTSSKFPIRWSSPEVLQYQRFSSKSDVWAFGVLMWEMYSAADNPYNPMRNEEVVSYITSKRGILQRPTKCEPFVYEIMRMCFKYDDADRPRFTELKAILQEASQRLPRDD